MSVICRKFIFSIIKRNRHFSINPNNFRIYTRHDAWVKITSYSLKTSEKHVELVRDIILLEPTVNENGKRQWRYTIGDIYGRRNILHADVRWMLRRKMPIYIPKGVYIKLHVNLSIVMKYANTPI